MRAKSDTHLERFEDWTLRVRPAESKLACLLLLIHGWTGDENSMWIFVRQFAPMYWIVAPRAPYATRPSGYSWRVSPAEPGAPPRLEDLRPAAESLVAFVDDYSSANGIEARQFDAMGFSQGAALVNTLALLYPERVGRLGILAGFVPSGAESLVEAHPLQGKRFFVAHGTEDERISVEVARQSIQLLERAGAHVTFCEDEVGHKVSTSCLRALEAFFA